MNPGDRSGSTIDSEDQTQEELDHHHLRPSTIQPSSSARYQKTTQRELESFRNDWLDQIKLNHTQHQPNLPQASPSTSIHSPAHSHPSDSNSLQLSQSPLFFYSRAVHHERTGLLDDALIDYRKAFKLEPNIDRVYQNLKPEQIDSIERRWFIDGSSSGTIDPSDPPFRFSERSTQLDHDANDYHPASILDPSHPKIAHRPKTHHDGDPQHPSSTKRFLNSLISSFDRNPWQRNVSSAADVESSNDRSAQTSLPPSTDDHDGHALDLISQQISDLDLSCGDEHPQHPNLSSNLLFEPLELERPCSIQKIPPELILQILSSMARTRSTVHLAVGMIERFGRVSRFARVITLEPSIWRWICETIYQVDLFVNHYNPSFYPRLARLEYVGSLCTRSHGLDWRRMYIEQPRIRLDGCYIALIRYPRLGESANPWYSPTHFVTYFRYLRFFENGTCLSLTSTEQPNTVVRGLKWPSKNSSSNTTTTTTLASNGLATADSGSKTLDGLLYGFWILKDNFLRVFQLDQDFKRHVLLSEHATNAHDAIDNSALRYIVGVDNGPDRPHLGRFSYQFEIDCRVMSTRRGKMNKLEISRLSTINLNNGEVLEVPLPKIDSTTTAKSSQTGGEQDEEGACTTTKPFIFSRVVSYDN